MSLQRNFFIFQPGATTELQIFPVAIEHGTMKETEFSCPFFYFFFFIFIFLGGGGSLQKTCDKKSERATCILGYIAEYPSHDLIL